MGKVGHTIPSRRGAWNVIVPADELRYGRGSQRYYTRAVRFMRRSKDLGQPFFLMANSHDPHRPFAASEAEEEYRLTHTKNGGLPWTPLAFDPDEVTVPGFLPDLPEIRQELAEYYTSVKRADATTGALLRALDDAGLAENTLVMFLSDNGMAFPFAKTGVWMHSTRTPWIVRWPGAVEYGVTDDRHVISGVDLAPTLLDAAGERNLRGADGKSFLRALRGKPLKGFDYAFTQVHKTRAGTWYAMRSIIGRRHGYIYNHWARGDKVFYNNAMSTPSYFAMEVASQTDSYVAARLLHLLHRTREELYDYRYDPDALSDLAADRADPDLLDDYRHVMYEHMRTTGDPQLPRYESYLQSLP